MRYYGLRYYNPSTGRWLSPDPIGEQGGLNRYCIALNDTISFWDILGQKTGIVAANEVSSSVPPRPPGTNEYVNGSWVPLGTIQDNGAGAYLHYRDRYEAWQKDLDESTTLVLLQQKAEAAEKAQQALTQECACEAPRVPRVLYESFGITPEEYLGSVGAHFRSLAQEGLIFLGGMALERVAVEALAYRSCRIARAELAAENAGLRGVQLNKAIGDATADAIASRYPLALREVPMNTVGGVRRVDVLTLGERNIAIESKVGLTGLDSRIRQELARDWWLRRTGKVDDVIWEFTPSPITGQGGATPALLDKLNKLGIGTVGP